MEENQSEKEKFSAQADSNPKTTQMIAYLFQSFPPSFPISHTAFNFTTSHPSLVATCASLL